MLILETAAVAFSMFSALPVPQPVWNQRNMRYAMCAFPLVGLVLGALWWCWAALCCRLALPELLRGAGLCLLPVVVTGGIHLDGYADTSDALASYAPPERRREILSDSHCGAFAIIRLCTYFVGYFALCTAVDPTGPAALCMGLSFVLSRAMSGVAITAFPLAKDTGLAHTFASAAHRGRARIILAATVLLTGVLMWVLGTVPGAAMTAAAAVVMWHYSCTARTKFGGITGDLAGWFMQRAEFWMLAALVVCQQVEELL